jgi:hypothetical protein
MARAKSYNVTGEVWDVVVTTEVVSVDFAARAGVTGTRRLRATTVTRKRAECRPE